MALKYVFMEMELERLVGALNLWNKRERNKKMNSGFEFKQKGECSNSCLKKGCGSG